MMLSFICLGGVRLLGKRRATVIESNQWLHLCLGSFFRSSKMLANFRLTNHHHLLESGNRTPGLVLAKDALYQRY